MQSLQARISLGKKTKPTTLLFHCYIPIPNEHPQCVFYQVSRVRPEHRHLHSLKKCQISHATHVFNATRATLQSHTVHTCYTLRLRYTPKVCITCNTRYHNSTSVTSVAGQDTFSAALCSPKYLFQAGNVACDVLHSDRILHGEPVALTLHSSSVYNYPGISCQP